jgi:hypothetical protein
MKRMVVKTIKHIPTMLPLQSLTEKKDFFISLLLDSYRLPKRAHSG